MKNKANHPGNILDGAVADIRNAAASPEQAEQAAARVLRKLAAEYDNVVLHPAVFRTEDEGMDSAPRIESCRDFQTLIPAYLNSSLVPARKLLLQDHTHECVDCRHALEQARRGVPPVRVAAPARRSFRSRRPAFAVAIPIAAVLLLTLALGTGAIRNFIWPIDVHAVAQTVNGGLYSVSGQNISMVRAGQRIEKLQAIRTGNDSGAVIELADGSRIEMSARAELSLDRASDGVTIKLGRGNVIVTAARQHNGHLYLQTPDCTVCVVGTVFSVSAGVSGSRVSVIEGEVQVQQGQTTQAVRPGQQLTTNPAMQALSVQQDIAWSRDLDKYIALLKEFQAFGEDVTQRIQSVPMRHTSDLVPLVPAGTVMFASLPNISQSIAASYTLFKQRVSENPAVASWWTKGIASPDGISFSEMIDRVTRLGAYLGPEVVIAGSKDTFNGGLVLLADVTNADTLVAALRDDIARVTIPQSQGSPGIRIAQSSAELQAAASSQAHLVVYVDRTLLMVSGDARQIQRSLEFRQQPGTNSFTSSALYHRLEQSYISGAGWLLAADLAQMIEPGSNFQQTGLGDMQQLVVEQTTGAQPEYRANLGFSQARRGVAGWLGDPAPMGALEFVSPNAYGVSAIVTKDPALIVDDLFALLQGNPNAAQQIDDYQREHHIDIRRDIAAPLGNEFLVAVDGPILPTPSWKVVIEVNDAARLQNAIQWSIDDLNRESAARQGPAITLSSELSGGRMFYSVTPKDLPTEIHYAFWAGYMIMAPSRALLTEAIQNHDTGNSLGRAAAFRSQLPSNGHDYASGIVYQNAQAVASALPVDVLKGSGLGSIPTLVCLYGEPDRIVMASKGVLGLNVASMIGIGGMGGLMDATGLKAHF